MKLEVTERDKKLLVGLAAVLLILGMIMGIIRPLMDTNQKVKEEISQAQIEKQEKELKVANLPLFQKREEEGTKQLNEMRSNFYGLMKSVEVDRMLTSTALNCKVKVEDMSIEMPDMENYAFLIKYPDILEGKTGESSETSGEETNTSFGGIYAATVTMKMSGSRKNLQEMLDTSISQHPKQRVTKFEWQKNQLAGSKSYTLTMTVELYMCEDVETYIAKQMVAQNTAEEEKQADGDSAVEE